MGKQDNQSFDGKVMGSVRNPGPMKPKLDLAVRQIQVSCQTRLCIHQTQREDNSIFSKVVTSQQKHDTQHASVYADELVEVREMNRMVTQARLALEQIVFRLSTITELGDIVVTLAPAMAVMRKVKQGLGDVMPEAEGDISEIFGLLSSNLVDAGTVGGYSVNVEAANEDAERILSEASAVAEQRMKKSSAGSALCNRILVRQTCYLVGFRDSNALMIQTHSRSRGLKYKAGSAER